MLWEENINCLNCLQSYKLENVLVKEYACEKYLTLPKSGAQISSIPDLQGVSHLPHDDINADKVLIDATVVGVIHIDSHNVCFRCKARVEPLTPPSGRCSKPECNMLQCFDKCPMQVSAKLLFATTDGKMQPIVVYGNTLSEILGDKQLSEENLKIPQFSSVITQPRMFSQPTLSLRATERSHFHIFSLDSFTHPSYSV